MHTIITITEHDNQPDTATGRPNQDGGIVRLQQRIDGPITPDKAQRIIAILLEPPPKQKKRRSDFGSRRPREIAPVPTA